MLELNARIELLERSISRLRRLIISVISCALALFLVASKQQEATEIVAQSFLLQDQSGKVRARLDLSSSGTPSFLMYYPDGKEAVELGVANNLPALLLRDRASGKRIDLGLDKNGVPSAILAGLPSGSAAIVVRGSHGNRQITAP